MSTKEGLIKKNELAYGKRGDEFSSKQYEQDMSFPYKNNKTILFENKSILPCTMKGKSTPPNITYPAMMEVCEVIYELTDYTPSCDGG